MPNFEVQMKKLSEYFYFNFKEQRDSSESYDYILVEIIDDVVKREKIFIIDMTNFLKRFGYQEKV